MLLGKIASILTSVVGGSPAQRVEWAVYDVKNGSIKEMSMDVTVCLQPQIVDGRKLVFRTHPGLRNPSGPESGSNIFGDLRNSISHERGERILIMSIVRTSCRNELDGTVNFEVSNLFDKDDDMDRIRRDFDRDIAKGIAESEQMLQQRSGGMGSNTTTKKIINVSKPKPKPKPAKDTDRLDAPSDADVHVDALMTDDESERVSVRASSSSSSSVTVSNNNNDDDRAMITNLVVKGKMLHRNRVELQNGFDFKVEGKIQETARAHVLYKASISREIVKWFAGHEEAIRTTPGTIVHSENTDPETRGSAPIRGFCIYPEGHSLLRFIDMFAEDLEVRPDDRQAMGGDRNVNERFYKISVDLIERARKRIKEIVFAQFYYTTLTNCCLSRKIVRPPSSSSSEEEQEHLFVLNIAMQWGLKIDPKTRLVSDWVQGTYRPVVIVGFHIEYFVVFDGDDAQSEGPQGTNLQKVSTRLAPV